VTSKCLLLHGIPVLWGALGFGVQLLGAASLHLPHCSSHRSLPRIDVVYLYSSLHFVSACAVSCTSSSPLIYASIWSCLIVDHGCMVISRDGGREPAPTVFWSPTWQLLRPTHLYCWLTDVQCIAQALQEKLALACSSGMEMWKALPRTALSPQSGHQFQWR